MAAWQRRSEGRRRTKKGEGEGGKVEPTTADADISLLQKPKDTAAVETVVEKTPENEFKYKEIKQNFDNHKVVHIVRDPIVNLASLKRNALNLNYQFNLPVSIDAIFKSLYCSIVNSDDNEDYMVLRYEDLTSDLNNKMISVCSAVSP